jgi:hypothetical protein
MTVLKIDSMSAGAAGPGRSRGMDSDPSRGFDQLLREADRAAGRRDDARDRAERRSSDRAGSHAETSSGRRSE